MSSRQQSSIVTTAMVKGILFVIAHNNVETKMFAVTATRSATLPPNVHSRDTTLVSNAKHARWGIPLCAAVLQVVMVGAMEVLATLAAEAAERRGIGRRIVSTVLQHRRDFANICKVQMREP